MAAPRVSRLAERAAVAGDGVIDTRELVEAFGARRGAALSPATVNTDGAAPLSHSVQYACAVRGSPG